MFYQDIDDSSVTELIEDLQPQCLGAFWSTTTHAAWRWIPTTYIVCTKDKPSTVVAARWLVDSARASGEHRIDKVVEVKAGHSPFISMPEWTVGVLVGEAERSVQIISHDSAELHLELNFSLVFHSKDIGANCKTCRILCM